ncbi:hypothetical protein [Deinococcus sp. Leaf326]|uniref:hypothetical protein n=1 Tax=Deinococcus sp. Leaf326 TaxID=1736338 RepID=UPI000701192B|nr:hypothetical protein [Deinococcus sp. Leaf326]KQR18885.1 hypothetical protein ASF71_19835 [Deinococcus sp. Leaf326]
MTAKDRAFSMFTSAREVDEWLAHQRRLVQEIVTRRQELAAVDAQRKAEWEEIQRQWNKRE